MALLLGRDHLSFPSLVSQQPRGEEHISQENRCTFLVGFIWCERRSFAQEKATSFRESQAVRKGKNNIRSWWSSLQYITWLSFRGCPVVEPFGFRCLEHIPAEISAGQQYCLQGMCRSTFCSTKGCNTSQLCIRQSPYCWQWSKLTGQ